MSAPVRRNRLSDAARALKERTRTLLKAHKKVYAIRIGRETGIFDTWKEVEERTTGHNKATYKSFIYREDAADWLDGGEGDLQLDHKWIALRNGESPGIYRHVEDAVQAAGPGGNGAALKFFDTQAEAREFMRNTGSTPKLSTTGKRKRTSEGADEQTNPLGSSRDPKRLRSRQSNLTPTVPRPINNSPSLALNGAPDDISHDELTNTHRMTGGLHQRQPKSRGNRRKSGELEVQYERNDSRELRGQRVARDLDGVREGYQEDKGEEDEMEQEGEEEGEEGDEMEEEREEEVEENNVDQEEEEVEDDAELEDEDEVEDEEVAGDVYEAGDARIEDLQDDDNDDFVPKSFAELELENRVLRAELDELRREKNLRNAASSSRPPVYTLLLARDNGKFPKKQGPHPEDNLKVLGTFKNVSDATKTAWNVYREFCNDHKFLKLTDHGVTDELLDRREMKSPGLYKRITKEAEVRLYWRDTVGRSGFIMVQKQHVRDTDEISPIGAGVDRQDKRDDRDAAYLVCEHYKSLAGPLQDGGLLGAYRTLDRANAAAEKMFRLRFMRGKKDPIKEVPGLGATMTGGQGAWRYTQKGRATFIRGHENGRGKIWVERFTVK